MTFPRPGPPSTLLPQALCPPPSQPSTTTTTVIWPSLPAPPLSPQTSPPSLLPACSRPGHRCTGSASPPRSQPSLHTGPTLILQPTLRTHSPHTLGHGPHRLLGDENVAGKTAQQRVFGDEAKIAAGRAAVSTRGHQGTGPPLSPQGSGRRGRNREGSGRACGAGECAGQTISRFKAPFWVPVQAQRWASVRS